MKRTELTTKELYAIAYAADCDVRSVKKELAAHAPRPRAKRCEAPTPAPQGVRGRAGDRLRSVLRERGLIP